MLRVSALYPNTPDSHFDGVYYLASHSPFAEQLLRPHGLVSTRTALGQVGLDGAPPPFWAICEMIFGSRDQFDASMQACGQELFADIANYTNSTPILQISRMPGEPE